MVGWKLEDFAAKVYNADYVQVDPDYLEARPRGNAEILDRTFPAVDADIRHLDYGGGNGLLAEILLDRGWQSASYDVFVDRDIDIRDFGSFDLITAFEVFEHVPDPARLVAIWRRCSMRVASSCSARLSRMATSSPGSRCNGGTPRRAMVTSAFTRAKA